jgi:hypothetical protein
VRRSVAAAASIALAVAASAAGHGGPGPVMPGFKATVTGLQPGVRGVTVRVLGGEDRLWLRNVSGRELTILGYEGEPYLRFTLQGIFQNRRSPAAYLNVDRWARVVVPPSAHAGAAPVWKRLARSRAWAWHDHRIHWMSTFPPAPVVEDRQSPHHVFDWSVPARLGRHRLAIVGSLDYEPPPNP